MTRLPAVVSIAACIAFVACLTGDHHRRSSDFEALWRRYQELPEPRALAIAGDPDTTLWVGAAAAGQATQAEAERQAVAKCMEQRAKRRLQVPCRLYAVGDFVIWEPDTL